MNEINTNMVPFPKLNFLASSFSPFGICGFSKVSNAMSRKDNFWNTCSKSNQLVKIDPMEADSALIAAMLIGRGEYSVTVMRKYVDILQNKAPFQHWSRKCIKIGLCGVAPNGLDYSMLALFNTSTITNLFDYVSSHYQKLLRRKAHIHHYTEVQGFEFDHFNECQNIIATVTDHYEEIKKSKTEAIPRLESDVFC
ncbi:hypothetical protein HHI36_013400 [Cryptolaemus montrouzieri]|uniref:Tubulin/FtsZ 2-layer sandwich domain-containing protein n=1 Tax=Cryptolaemus montrouzieri TaxID=559131 RepID=A0ABD2NH60_9CUCU